MLPPHTPCSNRVFACNLGDQITNGHVWKVALAADTTGKPRLPSTPLFPPALPGESQGIPRLGWPPPCWTCPKHLQEASLPGVQTTSVVSFRCSGAAVLFLSLPGCHTPPPISKSEISHQTGETHFSHLDAQSPSFGHDPKLITTLPPSWGLEPVDRPLNWELRLPTKHPLHRDRPVEWLHRCRCHSGLSVDLVLHPTLTFE